MQQQGTCHAVLDTVEVSDDLRRWIVGRSAEAVEVRERVASIVRLLDDLGAAIENLGPEVRAYELSRQVRAEMIQNLLIDAAEHVTSGCDVAGHPTDRSSFGRRTSELRRWAAKLVAAGRSDGDKQGQTG